MDILTKGRQDRTTALALAYAFPTLYPETGPHALRQFKHATSHPVYSSRYTFASD